MKSESLVDSDFFFVPLNSQYKIAVEMLCKENIFLRYLFIRQDKIIENDTVLVLNVHHAEHIYG